MQAHIGRKKKCDLWNANFSFSFSYFLVQPSFFLFFSIKSLLQFALYIRQLLFSLFDYFLIPWDVSVACFSVHVRGSEYMPLLGSEDPTSFLLGAPNVDIWCKSKLFRYVSYSYWKCYLNVLDQGENFLIFCRLDFEEQGWEMHSFLESILVHPCHLGTHDKRLLLSSEEKAP